MDKNELDVGTRHGVSLLRFSTQGTEIYFSTLPCRQAGIKDTFKMKNLTFVKQPWTKFRGLMRMIFLLDRWVEVGARAPTSPAPTIA